MRTGRKTSVYLIAVKRECRAEIGADWLDALRDAPGVEMGDGETVRIDARRVTVRATHDGLAELRERVGAFCHIEPLIVHEPQPGPDPGQASRSSTRSADPDEP